MILKIKNFFSNYPKIYLLFKKVYFGMENAKRYMRIIISIPFTLLPIQNKKIIISNYYGKGYGDNGKYIVEEIIRQGLDYDIVWLLKKELVEKLEFPQEVRTVKYGSLKGLYELATAKVWIDNCRKVFYPLKRKEQFYIQTWHGGLGLKKVEKDVEYSLSKQYIKQAKQDSKMADLFISNSIFLTEIYEHAFWYSGDILESGHPRNDIYFKENLEIENKIKKHYDINKDTRIILYAPTFRANSSFNAYNIDYFRLLSNLEEMTNKDWVIFIRLHPNLMGLDNKMQYNKKIINTTNYQDMQELVIASDILISDYSSCLFDSAMMKIPTFIYASDIEEYTKDRGFYLRFEELSFPLATNNDELIRNIKNFDEKKYALDVDDFNKRFGVKDNGDASKIIVDVIRTKIEKSK